MVLRKQMNRNHLREGEGDLYFVKGKFPLETNYDRTFVCRIQKPAFIKIPFCEPHTQGCLKTIILRSGFPTLALWRLSEHL
jgi:hypothetical protein